MCRTRHKGQSVSQRLTVLAGLLRQGSTSGPLGTLPQALAYVARHVLQVGLVCDLVLGCAVPDSLQRCQVFRVRLEVLLHSLSCDCPLVLFGVVVNDLVQQ